MLSAGTLQISGDPTEGDSIAEESIFSGFFLIERNLRYALKPIYEVLFETLNACPAGLKFLSSIRAEYNSSIEVVFVFFPGNMSYFFPSPRQFALV